MAGPALSRPPTVEVPKVVRGGVLLLVILFIVTAVYGRLRSNVAELEGGRFAWGVGPVLGLACFVLAVVATSLLWKRVLERLGAPPVPTREAVATHVASWLLKYIPGQVGSLVWKLRWGSERGVAKSVIGTSFLYENLLLGIASTVYTLPILVVTLGGGGGTGAYVAAAAVIAGSSLALSSRPVLLRLLRLLVKVTRRSTDVDRLGLLTSPDLLRFQLEFLVPRLLNAAGFVLILDALAPVDAVHALAAGAAYVLAGIIGILAIYVPSGIGVREAVVVVFLSRFLSTDVAVLAAVNARIYATVADVVLAGLLALLRATDPADAAGPAGTADPVEPATNPPVPLEES